MTNQVIDKHTYISLGALQNQRLSALHGKSRINAGHQALACRFLIACRAIYLPSQKKPLHPRGFQCRPKLAGIYEIVFNSVTGPYYLYTFETVDHPQKLELKRRRERCGKSV